MPDLEIFFRETEVLAKYDEFFTKLLFTNRKKPQFLTIKNVLFTKSKEFDQLSKNLTLKLHKTSKQFTAATIANNHSTTLH